MMLARELLRALAGYVLAAAAVALAVATLAFAAVQLAPGDIAFRVAEARYGENMTVRSVDRIREAADLDKPVAVQYLRWVEAVFTGDLGRSIVSHRPVTPEVWRGFRSTLGVTALGVSLALGIGLVLGFAAGFRRDSLLDRGFLATSAMLSSVPPFLIGMMLITLFAIRLHWLPAAGANLPGYYVLPSFTLALALLPDLARVVRNSAVRTMHEFFPTYARIKGQSWPRIVVFHALRPTLVPIIAFFGPLIAHAIGGLVVIDVLFNLDGLGTVLIDSVLNADIPLATGAGLFIGLFVVTVTATTDILVRLLDPRTVSREAGA